MTYGAETSCHRPARWRRGASHGGDTQGMIAGCMSIQRTRRTSGSTGLIITLLALVALLGLLTGFLTHTLISRSTAAAQVLPSTTATQLTTPATTHAPSTGASATATTPAGKVSAQFQLSISISPRVVATGQQLTITVNAFDPDTHAPIAGLPCILRAPTDGSPALLTSWPASQTTNASGAASWTLAAPSMPAGTYEVEAFAQSAKWSWKADATVGLRAN